jgi:hypothetical protein
MTEHLTESDVLAFATSDRGRKWQVLSHVRTCGACRRQFAFSLVERPVLDAYIEHRREEAAQANEPCLTDESIAALVEGASRGKRRDDVLDHLEWCEQCWRDVLDTMHVLEQWEKEPVPDIPASASERAQAGIAEVLEAEREAVCRLAGACVARLWPQFAELFASIWKAVYQDMSLAQLAAVPRRTALEGVAAFAGDTGEEAIEDIPKVVSTVADLVRSLGPDLSAVTVEELQDRALAGARRCRVSKTRAQQVAHAVVALVVEEKR